MAFTPDPSILRGTEMFAGLSDAELRDVLSAGRLRRLPSGAQVFAQGDPGVSCHSLLHGRVKILQTRPDGSQHLIRFIGPGEMFGTIAALMDQPFPADAIAVVESLEVSWTVEAMRELMQRFPDIGLRATRGAGERLMELQNRIGELCAERVEQRIARALVRLVRQAGRRTEEGIEIDFPISRQELAEMSGSTLHTASRTLSAWEDRGIVRSGRKRIVVVQPHALVALAEDLAGKEAD